MKTGNIIGLDLGFSMAKMVEYSREKKQVTTIAKLFLDPQDWDQEKNITKKIRNWILEKKQAKNIQIVAAVPAEYSIIHKAWIPLEEQKIAETIRWELEEYIGQSSADYLMDYQTLAAHPNQGYTEYLLGAYRKSEVLRLKKILHSSAMPLAVLDVDAFACQNAYEANYPENNPFHTLLIKADYSGVSCIHTYKGKFLNFQSFVMPDQFLKMSDDAKSGCYRDQAQKVKKFYLQSFLGQITGDPIVMLCGDLSNEGEFMRLLQQEMEMDIGLLDSFKEVNFPHDPEHAEKVADTSPQCAVALGLALRYRGDS